MGTKRKVYLLVGGAIVVIVAAAQLRSALVSAMAYQAETHVAWGEDVRTDLLASQLVEKSGGSYFIALSDRRGEVAYFGIPPQTQNSAMSRKARMVVEDMVPTFIVVARDFVIDLDIVPESGNYQTVRVEMTDGDERDVLFGRYGPEEASLYLAVREYWRAVELDQLDRNDADSFLMSLKSSLELSWPGETVAAFDKYWLSRYPGISDWRYSSSRILEPGHDYGVLGEIAKVAAHAYDVHTVRVIAELIAKGERVVAFASPLMVARLEPVLRASIGLPVTVPAFNDDYDNGLSEKAIQIQPVIKQTPPNGVTAPSHVDPVIDIK